MAPTLAELEAQVQDVKRRLDAIERGLAEARGGPPPAPPTEGPRALSLGVGSKPFDPRVLPGELLARALSHGPSALVTGVGVVPTAPTAPAGEAPLTADEIRRLQRGGDPDAILISNLGYVSLLMSEQYRRAAGQVRDTLAKRQGRQIAIEWTGRIARGLFVSGLSAVTAGVAAELARIVSHATEYVLTEATVEAGAHALFDRSMGQPAEAAIEGVSEKAAFERSAEIDPLEFFLEQEKRLRLMAMHVAARTVSAPITAAEGARVSAIKDAVKAYREAAARHVLAAVDDKAGTLVSLLNRPISDPDLAAALRSLEEDWLPVLMKRLIWRNYCRTQWAKEHFRYTVTLGAAVPPREGAWLEPASEWPGRVWLEDGHGWPLHFDDICADFKGPEHQAHLGDRAWISLAVVHCCQVRRPRAGDAAKGWLLDLERQTLRFGGGERALGTGDRAVGMGLRSREHVKDYDLLYKSLGDLAGQLFKPSAGSTRISAAEVLRAARTEGRAFVSITEMRVASERLGAIAKTLQKRSIGRLGVATSGGTEREPCLELVAGEVLVVTVSASEKKLDRAVRVEVTKLDAPAARVEPIELTYSMNRDQTAQFTLPVGRYSLALKAGDSWRFSEGATSEENPIFTTSDADRVRRRLTELKKDLVFTDTAPWYVQVVAG
jgi:hypothetical protein